LSYGGSDLGPSTDGPGVLTCQATPERASAGCEVCHAGAARWP